MAFLNLAAIRACTEAEGPGKRFALWCQGCHKRCAGCCNQHMQPLVPAHIVAVDDLKQMIIEAKQNFAIEGITCIGGEPLLQAEGLADLAAWCHQQDLTVMVFTGYLYEEAVNRAQKDEKLKLLLANTDILVDGPFVQEKYDTEREWVGSSNQRFMLLTDVYKAGIEYGNGKRSLEVRISYEDIAINGWPFVLEKTSDTP